MLDFYIMWNYNNSHSDRPVKVRAYNAKEAVRNFTQFHSDDFIRRATVFAFTEPPVTVWRNGDLRDDREYNF